MTHQEIEEKALELQGQIWRDRHILWPDGAPVPLLMLDPAAAAAALDVKFEVHEDLGCPFGFRGAMFETAGLIDRQRMLIAVSRRFRRRIVLFTGAHEVGHWLLHPREILHRDRPIDAPSSNKQPRPPSEREADDFAGCFLLPPKLVVPALEKTFGVRERFRLDEDAAFRLCGPDCEILLSSGERSLERASAVASATAYGNTHFNSLADQFDVSPTTMAIRLLQLGLVE